MIAGFLVNVEGINRLTVKHIWREKEEKLTKNGKKKNKNEYEDKYQLSTEEKKTQTQNDTCILQS